MSAAVELHQRHHRLTAVPDAVPSAVPVTKAARDWPNEITIMKRVPSTPAKEDPPMSSFETLLKSACRAIENDDLDGAERLLSKADRMVDVSTHHHHYYGSAKNGNNNNDDDEEDDDFEDTWSEGADAKSKYNNATKAASNNNSDDDGDMEDDDDEDEDDVGKIRKASEHYDVLGGSAKLPPPKPTPESAGGRGDTYALGAPSPANQTAKTHKFDRLVENIQERDNCSKNEAMSRARREFPDVYTAFQDFVASSPTSEQATRRAGRGVGKRMSDTFEDLVATEMKKGCSWRTAEQRVINVHGSAALNHRMIKRAGPSVATEFTKRANAILEADGVDRCEALRRLRKEKPYLYDALNNS
jgi:hypothetical protein